MQRKCLNDFLNSPEESDIAQTLIFHCSGDIRKSSFMFHLDINFVSEVEVKIAYGEIQVRRSLTQSMNRKQVSHDCKIVIYRPGKVRKN